MNKETTIIDAHSHVARPEEDARGYFSQTYDEWLMRMDECGIDKAVIMCGTEFNAEAQEKSTSYLIEAVRKHPEKFIGQITISPLWGKTAIRMMDWADDNGLRGIKLCPQSQGFYSIDEEVVNPLIEAAEKKEWWVMIHTDFTSTVCSPLRAINLAQRFPFVNFILSHMGVHPDYIKATIDYSAPCNNVFLDTSATPNMPYFTYKYAIEKLPERVLFGSDAPGVSPELELEKVNIAEKRFGLTPDEKKRILYMNAKKVFRL